MVNQFVKRLKVSQCIQNQFEYILSATQNYVDINVRKEWLQTLENLCNQTNITNYLSQNDNRVLKVVIKSMRHEHREVKLCSLSILLLINY